MKEHKFVIIVLLALCAARSAAGQEADKIYFDDPRCPQAASEQHVAMADSFYRAVLDIYPLELLDTAAWRIAHDSLRAQAWRERYYSNDSEFGMHLRTVIDRLFENAVTITSYVGACNEIIVMDERMIIADSHGPVEWNREANQLGALILRDWSQERQHLIACMDTAMDSLSTSAGLLLDIRRSETLTMNDAALLLGRFASKPLPLCSARVRVRGTQQYYDSVIVAQPRGTWQFTRPIVAIMDSSSTWISGVMAATLDMRTNVEIIGFAPHFPRAVLPVDVELPGGTNVEIPSAILLWPRQIAHLKTPKLRAPRDDRDDVWREYGLKRLYDLTVRDRRQRQDRMERMFEGRKTER